MLTTIVTSWYKLSSKYTESEYMEWICNFLSNVNNCHIFVFTNEKSLSDVKYYENENVTIILH